MPVRTLGMSSVDYAVEKLSESLHEELEVSRLPILAMLFCISRRGCFSHTGAPPLFADFWNQVGCTGGWESWRASPATSETPLLYPGPCCNLR